MQRITLRLPDRLHKQLRARAQRSGTSLNQLIVETLDDAPPSAEETPPTPLSARDEETRKLRIALKDILVEINADDWLAIIPNLVSQEEAAAILAAMPPLHPSLSQTIIAEREESRF
ncbi:MAG: toxin-antitoxin system HicB family antitoxin [Dehalococcoidia bacterium]